MEEGSDALGSKEMGHKITLEQIKKLKPGMQDFDKRRGVMLMRLADYESAAADLVTAESHYRNALHYMRKSIGDYDPRTQQCLNRLIGNLQAQKVNNEVKSLKQQRAHVATTIAGPPPADQDKFIDWVKNSSELGHPSAPTLMGLAYLNGQGVEKDLEKSREYFLKAVEQADGCGTVQLGLMYMNGVGVEKNPGKAKGYFEQAARYGVWYPSSGPANNADAQYELGVASLTGNGLNKEQKDAYIWFTLVANSSSAKSPEAKAKLEAITKTLTPEEKDEYDQNLEVWKESQQLAIYPKFVAPPFTE